MKARQGSRAAAHCLPALLALAAMLCAPTARALESAAADAVERVCLADGELIASGDSTALVACAPHATLAGLPVARVATCGRTATGWRCNAPVLAARETIGRRTVLVTPQGLGFAAAAEITRVVREHPYTFNGRDLAQLLQGWCKVADLGPGAFAGARDYRVRCGERGVIITKACAQGACRLFPARWDDEAPTPDGAGAPR